MDSVIVQIVVFAAAGLLVGIGIGYALRRPDRSAQRREQALEAELAELRGELDELQRESDGYRSSVEKHFVKTSELFRSLTEHYTDLYGHLAGGARELCPEGSPALGRGLDDPLLAATIGAPESGEDPGALGPADLDLGDELEESGEPGGDAERSRREAS